MCRMVGSSWPRTIPEERLGGGGLLVEVVVY